MAELELAREAARLREAGASSVDLSQAVEAFNRQRTVAEKRLRDLVIHREAAGFRRNQIVYDLHPIPPREH